MSSPAFNGSPVVGTLPVSVSGTPAVTVSNAVALTRSTSVPFAFTSFTSTSGNHTAAFATGGLDELLVLINITAFTGGSSPTIQYFVEVTDDGNNNWYAIYSGTAIGTTGVQPAISIGAGLANAQSFGQSCRVRWVLGGAPTNVQWTLSVLGK